jgi:hypothetical protein
MTIMRTVRMRSQVLTAARMKMVSSWAIAPCSLVEVY